MVNIDSYLTSFFKLLLFLLVVSAPLFLNLDVLPVRLYDESRNAVNAAEMLLSKDWIVTRYNGAPDMWNTKPPLLFWFQASLFKCIGINELALRLPSAIAALLTCVALLVFSIKRMGSYWLGIIASLILVTSVGYVSIHGTRTGDFDSLLTLFITLYSLAAFSYTEGRKGKHLVYFFLFVVLAALTKGVQAFIMLPAIFLYGTVKLWQKLTWSAVSAIVFGGLLAMLAIGSYYLLREQHNPGYLLAVWQNELGGRYMQVNENNTAGFFFYIENIANHHFYRWFWLVPIGFLLGVFSSQQALKKFTLFAGFIMLWYLLIISSSETKLYWYALPLYPFLAVLAAIPVFTLFKIISKSITIEQPQIQKIAASLFLIAIFITPYAKAVKRAYTPHEHPWDIGPYSIFHYLKQPISESFNPDGKTICYDFYMAPIEFYQIALAHKGINIKLIRPKEIETGDTLLVYQPEVMEYITANFHTQSELVFKNSVKQYIIKAKN